MIDVSCFVGDGPLVRPEHSSAAAIEARLRQAGVTSAGVSAMPALFTAAPRQANDVLISSMVASDFFVAVPVLNPTDVDVVDQLEEHVKARRRVIRIVPGCHGYPATAAYELHRACVARGVTLVVQLRIVDARSVPLGLHLPDVPVADVLSLASSTRSAPLVVAGARAQEAHQLLANGPRSLHVDLSLAEEPDVVRRLIAAHGSGRLLVGSHAPFLTPAAVRAKIDAAGLPLSVLRDVTVDNARRLGW